MQPVAFVPKPGVHLGFSTPRRFNPVSWLVRKLTGSTASHAWFLYYDQDFQMDMVMEAHELGFRLLPFSRFERENKVVAVFSPTCDFNLGLKWAATWLGTAYDFTGLLGMAWVLIWRKLGKRVRNPLQRSHAMFCSEIATKALAKSGCEWAKRLRPSTVSPQQLMVLCAVNGEPRRE